MAIGVTMRSVSTRAGLDDFQRADMRAYGLKNWRPWLRFKYPTLYFQRMLRRTEYWDTKPIPILSRAIYACLRLRLKQISIRLGVSIPLHTFGRGLTIAHYGSVVVNDQVVAGEFVRLHNNVNIGVSSGEAPTIGDRVYIGPGAVLYGGITVGSDSVIGANSVVGRDVPAGVTVAGSPARVISHENSSRFISAAVLSEETST